MRTSSLYYFKRVAEIGRINTAAEELYISQSQLSRIIADIEHEVGVELFTRSNNRLSLNESGKVFYDYLSKVLGEFNEGMARAREAYDVGRTYFSIVTNMTSCTSGLISFLLKKIPELRIKEVPAPFKSCLRLLNNGNADCAITASAIEAPHIKNLVLRTGKVVLIYPEGHRFEDMRDTLVLEDILLERFVSMANGYGLTDLIIEQTEATSISVSDHVVIETADYRSVIRYVREGVGCALVPWSLASCDEFCLGHYADIFSETTFDMVLNWDDRHVMRPIDERCTELMKLYYANPDNR